MSPGWAAPTHPSLSVLLLFSTLPAWLPEYTSLDQDFKPFSQYKPDTHSFTLPFIFPWAIDQLNGQRLCLWGKSFLAIALNQF